MQSIVLESKVYGGVGGGERSLYRAALEHDKGGAVIAIYQPFKNGEYGRCGSWYLTTLLEGGSRDSLSIDYGQKWSISSGMTGAINEAVTILANAYKGA